MASAAVSTVEISRREAVSGGQSFGERGSYEKIVGSIHFEWDPGLPANRAVVDLRLAPTNEAGKVEARANFMVLQPLRPRRGGNLAFLEVSNRGGKAALRYFNAGPRGVVDPQAPEDYGNGLLLRLGLTVIWVGWQFDVPAEPGRLRLEVPAVTGNGGAIEGLVRADWVIEDQIESLYLGHRNHWAYPVVDPADARNVLTRRWGRDAPRELVPRDSWEFARESGGQPRFDPTYIYMKDGFVPGYVYELVYVAEDPRVVGLGLAVIRDTMSYAKYATDCEFGVDKGIGFGVSQTGRFLRHYLYQGFNVDEAGRIVFDGLMIHTAGAGRGSFNHRFGQPSRDAHRFSAFFYPTDLFPFTNRALLDVYQKADLLPKMVVTNTGYEYWGRAASLIHTSSDGKHDVDPLPNERIYHFASAQHFVQPWPPGESQRIGGTRAWRGDPVDFLVNLRALLVRLVDWVSEDERPPESRYPRLADRTLVAVGEVDWPRLPGVNTAKRAHVAYRADYGPRWRDGIITQQPPKLGGEFPSFVPQVDELGNELGGVRNVEVMVPVATYLPWNLRGGRWHPEELSDFLGTTVPLRRTDESAATTDDPRPSLESLYDGRDHYLEQVRAAAEKLVEEGFLLSEDTTRVVWHAAMLWDWASRESAK